jgi:hypothetical protein
MADASTEGMLTQEANLSGIIWSWNIKVVAKRRL